MTNYKLYHRDSKVFVIEEKDLPNISSYEVGIPGDEIFVDGGQAKYRSALEAALSTKGVEVRNAQHIATARDMVGTAIFKIGELNISMVPNQLYNIPSGFEVKIEDYCPLPCDCTERCEMPFEKRQQRATITPVQKQEPVKEEDQDDLEDAIRDEIDHYSSGRLEIPAPGQLAFNIAEAIKSKYSITRRS